MPERWRTAKPRAFKLSGVGRGASVVDNKFETNGRVMQATFIPQLNKEGPGPQLNMIVQQAEESLLVHGISFDTWTTPDAPDLEAPTITVKGLEHQQSHFHSELRDFTDQVDKKDQGWLVKDLDALPFLRGYSAEEPPLYGLLAKVQTWSLTLMGVASADALRVAFNFPRGMAWQTRFRLIRIRWRIIVVAGAGLLAYEYLHPLIPDRPPTMESPPSSAEEDYVMV